MERKIRNSAKALIFKDGRMAAIKIDDHGDIFYILPGGGQNTEELLSEAVIRECAEELGIAVKAEELAFIVEGRYGESFHRVDLVFRCAYIAEIPDAETACDTHQVGVEWLEIDTLESAPLYPSKLRRQIMDFYHNRPHKIYLGDESMGMKA